MWKKQLKSLSSFSINILRRNRPPCVATAASSAGTPFQQNHLFEFAPPLSSSYKSLLQEKCFSSKIFPSRAFENQKLQLGLSVQKSKLFCSVSASTSPDSVNCWNCNAPPSTSGPFLFCQNCRCVQPVDRSVDFFQILGMDRRYDVKGEDLEGRYKDWQKKLHPDLVHTKSQKEREYAAEQSTRVTEAYRTLTDPLSRAIYILKLEGVEVDEEARISDPQLLTEILEIREAVEEAADAHALNQIQVQVHEKFEYWSKAFAAALEQRKNEEAVDSIQKMTYYLRAKEEITKKL